MVGFVLKSVTPRRFYVVKLVPEAPNPTPFLGISVDPNLLRLDGTSQRMSWTNRSSCRGPGRGFLLGFERLL